MTTTSPVAAWMPRRTAAPLPRFSGCRMSVSMTPRSCSCSSTSRVPSRGAVVDADQLDVERHVRSRSMDAATVRSSL
jgi:hypothetical protein